MAKLRYENELVSVWAFRKTTTILQADSSHGNSLSRVSAIIRAIGASGKKTFSVGVGGGISAGVVGGKREDPFQ